MPTLRESLPKVVGEAGMLTKPDGTVDYPLSELWRLISQLVDCQRRRSEHSPTRRRKDMNGVPTSVCVFLLYGTRDGLRVATPMVTES